MSESVEAWHYVRQDRKLNYPPHDVVEVGQGVRMKRYAATFAAGLLLGTYLTLAYGTTVAGTLFQLGSRFAAAGTEPEYQVSVGSAVLMQPAKGKR